MAGSLLERLENPDAARDTAEISIQRNLLRMLTTRQGSVAMWPDYGLPDMNNLKMSVNEILQSMQQDVATMIERYEPRLINVSVTCLPPDARDRHLTFTVSGTVVEGNSRRPVRLEAALEADGKARLVRR